jgi:hypothetical protein
MSPDVCPRAPTNTHRVQKGLGPWGPITSSPPRHILSSCHPVSLLGTAGAILAYPRLGGTSSPQSSPNLLLVPSLLVPSLLLAPLSATRQLHVTRATHVCMHECTCARAYTCARAGTCAPMLACTRVCVCVSVHACMQMVCTHIHTTPTQPSRHPRMHACTRARAYTRARADHVNSKQP